MLWLEQGRLLSIPCALARHLRAQDGPLQHVSRSHAANNPSGNHGMQIVISSCRKPIAADLTVKQPYVMVGHSTNTTSVDLSLKVGCCILPDIAATCTRHVDPRGCM